MRLKIITFLLSVLLLYSCQNNVKNRQNENPINTKKELDTITSKTKKTLSEKDNYNSNKEKFFKNFKHLVKTTLLDQTYISVILSTGKNTLNHDSTNEQFLLGNYIMKSFDRSPKYIENFFGDNEIALAAKIIENSGSYFISNSDLMLNGFIKSFEELENDKEFLRKASLEKNNIKYVELLETKYSHEVRNIVDFASHYSTDNKLFIIYSFWVRRYNEGNAQIVYKILKKIEDKLPVRSVDDPLYFQRDKIISQIYNDEFSAFDFNKEALNFLISEINVRSHYFERFIADHSIFIPRDDNEREYFGEYNSELMIKLNELYSNVDRSPENIEKIFSDKVIDHIAFLFNSNFLPKDQKLYNVLKGLLLSYDEMNDKECTRLYNVMSELQYHDMRDKFDEKCSNKIKKFIYEGGDFKASVQTDSDIDFGYRKRIFYLYSFWVRRYNEGNKETVYNILKEIDNRIK